MSAYEYDVLKLVHLVKENRPLYDYTCKDYVNRFLVESLWSDIAQELQTSVVECKTKWQSLRTSFARALREERTIITQSKKRKHWYFYRPMSFLSEYMASKETFLAADMKPEINKVTESRFQSVVRKGSKRKKNKNKQAAMVELVKTPEPEDINMVFFKSLLPDVEKLSQRRKRQFKESVMKTLNDLLNEQEGDVTDP